jgi:hypothetical protein
MAGRTAEGFQNRIGRNLAFMAQRGTNRATTLVCLTGVRKGHERVSTTPRRVMPTLPSSGASTASVKSRLHAETRRHRRRPERHAHVQRAGVRAHEHVHAGEQVHQLAKVPLQQVGRARQAIVAAASSRGKRPPTSTVRISRTRQEVGEGSLAPHGDARFPGASCRAPRFDAPARTAV